jgi:hypothetical protein
MQIFTYEEMTPSEKTLNFIKQFAYNYRAKNTQTFGLN